MSRTGVKDPDQRFFLKDFAGLEGALMELKQEGTEQEKSASSVLPTLCWAGLSGNQQ